MECFRISSAVDRRFRAGVDKAPVTSHQQLRFEGKVALPQRSGARRGEAKAWAAAENAKRHVPTLEDLGASYAAEAKAAIDKAPALTELATELALFPVVGGQTLHQWAEDFIASGSKIDDLLAARADMEQKNRKAAATLRVEVIGILNRLRKNLALEMKDDPSLPRDLEGQVFGYLDMLEKTCADARAKGAEVEQIPPPPETPSGTSP